MGIDGEDGDKRMGLTKLGKQVRGMLDRQWVGEVTAEALVDSRGLEQAVGWAEQWTGLWGDLARRGDEIAPSRGGEQWQERECSRGWLRQAGFVGGG